MHNDTSAFLVFNTLLRESKGGGAARGGARTVFMVSDTLLVLTDALLPLNRNGPCSFML